MMVKMILKKNIGQSHIYSNLTHNGLILSKFLSFLQMFMFFPRQPNEHFPFSFHSRLLMNISLTNQRINFENYQSGFYYLFFLNGKYICMHLNGFGPNAFESFNVRRIGSNNYK